jgi:ribosome-binding factor A
MYEKSFKYDEVDKDLHTSNVYVDANGYAEKHHYVNKVTKHTKVLRDEWLKKYVGEFSNNGELV